MVCSSSASVARALFQTRADLHKFLGGLRKLISTLAGFGAARIPSPPKAFRTPNGAAARSSSLCGRQRGFKFPRVLPRGPPLRLRPRRVASPNSLSFRLRDFYRLDEFRMAAVRFRWASNCDAIWSRSASSSTTRDSRVSRSPEALNQ